MGALIDCRTRLSQLAREAAAIKRRRRALARHILADPELVMESRRRRVRLSSLDTWAAPPKVKACRRGHDTAEWGDWDGTRWQCRKCAEVGPVPKPSDNVPMTERKERNRIAAAWREHERALAVRERLAALDQIPSSRLNPPMAPPARPA